jgi:DNA-binding beta-propeller fold protein YncE
MRRRHAGSIIFLALAFFSPSVLFPEIMVDPEGVPGPYVLTRRLSEIKTIPVGDYPKSVTISPDHKRAYVCNLENGSVDIIDTDSLARIKRIRFQHTLIPLPDGSTRKDTFEEKPVEVAFTKQGRFVWISLLRAGGVVVLDTKGQLRAGPTFKRTTVINSANKTKRALNLRFIPTGEQPKVLAVSPDEKWVFVSNWRGSGVAVIDTKKWRRSNTSERGNCRGEFAFQRIAPTSPTSDRTRFPKST